MKNNVCDSRTFWKKIKPCFSNKGNICNKIMLVMKEEIVQKD